MDINEPDTKVVYRAITLHRLNERHVDDLFKLVDSSREHLRIWLPWVDANRSVADTYAFIRTAINQFNTGKGPQYAVYYKTEIAGICGFHPFDLEQNTGSIGYWLGPCYTGKGIMTLSVKALVAEGFESYGLNRIDIACATGNTRSRAVAERLGFTFEGVRPACELLHGRYVDHAVYYACNRQQNSSRAIS